MAIAADNFTIDSRGNIVLVNNATKEVNHFTEDGILVDQMPIDNYTDGFKVSLTKEDEPIFYSDSIIFANI